MRKQKKILLWLAFPIAFVALWELIIIIGKLPPFILPSPGQVFDRFLISLKDGTLLTHSLTTLTEMLTGLFVGTSVALFFGYIIAKSRIFEALISPILVSSQAIPIVAAAPLLVIWFGNGFFTKALICSLVVFFPVFVNTVIGIKSVPRQLSELAKSLNASKWQILVMLEIPSALALFLSGLKIGATLSVIGAVVGEFIGADEGLGFLINLGRGLFDTALVFVAVLTLMFIALSLYGILSWIEKSVLYWNDHQKASILK